MNCWAISIIRCRVLGAGSGYERIIGDIVLGARTSLSALSAQRELGSSPTVREGVIVRVGGRMKLAQAFKAAP